MTEDANPDEPNGPQVLAQFLQDWTRLWREELHAQTSNADASPLAQIPGVGSPPELAAAMDLWRKAMGTWAETMGLPTLGSSASSVGSRDRSAPSRSAAAAAASDPRDAEIERLARRVDALEARLARLEPTRRRRG
jgi:hypothetical protein